MNNILHKILGRRHYWRHASFDEVSELYLARMLRTFAVHLISIFVGVYLYNLGYSLVFIVGYMACFYALKMFFAFPALYYVRKHGPKHAILFSNLLYIPALLIFSYMPEQGAGYGLFVVALFGVLQGLSVTVYDYAYMVDFSKVKHAGHAGKELGFMQVLEKAASVAGPLAGGLIATFFGPQVAIVISAALFAVAAIPLLKTAEPIELKQKLKLRSYPWRGTYRGIIAQSGIGFDIVASVTAWSLFLAAVVMAGSDDTIYASLGALASISMAAAIIAAMVFGKYIDRKGGRSLLRIGVLSKSLSHALRPLVGHPAAAAGVNAIGEVSYTGYSMAFTRGLFDTADRSGHRLLYLFFIEISSNFGAALACVLLAVALFMFDPIIAFTLFFTCAAGFQILVATPQFAIYKK